MKKKLADYEYAAKICSIVFDQEVKVGNIYVPGVIKMLSILGERDSSILEYRYRYDMTYKEIAKAAGMSCTIPCDSSNKNTERKFR